ncbi:MAG: glycosyltransferase [Rhodobacter sp.]|jgi:glycosyltransferase involved in cell wall biosynthesis|nr:glycosyltransferase [Rhodobacter sp.]
MSIFFFLAPDKIKRFTIAVRQDGWRVALAKTRQYIALHRAGHGRTGLPAFSQRSEPHADASYLAEFWQEMARKESFHMSNPPAYLNKTRRIAMIGDLNLPQCRKYRVEQLEEFWTAQGVEYTYSHYQDIPRATTILQDATHLMFYRTQNTSLVSMYLYEARRLRLPVLYDLDDPLFSVSAYETYENMKALPAEMKQHFINEAPKYLDAMNLADIITVSTPGMRDHTRLYTNRPVHFRRNFADRATFEAADAALKSVEREGAGSFRVAFASGSMGHEIDFALIADDITEFLKEDRRRKLVILGHFDLNLLPAPLRGQLITYGFSDYDSYLEALASVDCAVMPLTDDAFNRCKSAVRVIDAAAVAVPSIVTPVGDMANMVQDGKTGHIVGNGKSWLDSLRAMAEDRETCTTMGRAARADLEATWAGRPALPVIEPEVVNWVTE